MTRPRYKPRDDVCVHEAGHAVAALAIGLPLLWVSAQPPDDERLGVCAWDYTDATPLEHAAVLLAGAVAEQDIWGVRPWEAYPHTGLSGDIARAKALGPDDPDQLEWFLIEAWKISRHALRDRTADILAVAKALGKVDRLDGDQVEAILAGATVAPGSGG